MDLSTSIQKLRTSWSKPIKSCHPVVEARNHWEILSEQLKAVTGDVIFRKWFSKVTPLVLAEDILILKCPHEFDAHWIRSQYQKIIDLLLEAQKPGLHSFFISAKDLNYPWSKEVFVPKESYECREQ